MRKIYWFISIILFFTSCNSKSEFPDFKKDKSGFYFNLTRIGENEKKPVIGDYITVDIQYLTMEDSVFFKGRRKIQIDQPDSTGLINSCFLLLAEGDAATFLIPPDNFFSKTLQSTIPEFLANDQFLKIDIHNLEIQTESEYQKEKNAFLKWIEDFGDFEQTLLTQFIEEQKIGSPPNENGLYKINLTEGTGKKVAIGDTIILHYEGRFLNGKFFDSTIKRHEPFGFVYGTEWQVIEGLEEAIGTMRAGEKSMFILPSELAFGEKGSSTGIVPPYTSVIFEVELLEVK